MRLIYFDEVKYHPPVQQKYRIGALSVPDGALANIEARVNEIAQNLFGSVELSRETEFHAVHMVQGTAHFKGRPIADRLDALEKVLAVASDPQIRRISVTVDPSLMFSSPDSAPDKAFTFFVERAQHDLSKTSEMGILVGDLDGQYADTSVSNLSKYRRNGTPYFFGRSIDRLLDSVHFIPSHHSRLVQLADAYSYCLQLLASDPSLDRYPKARLRKFIREQTDLYWANSYKDWPTADSWALAASAA